MTKLLTTEATVLSTSRRFAELLLYQDRYPVLQARTVTKALDVCVGQQVSFEHKAGDLIVTKAHSPRNCLIRSYRGQIRTIAANIDQLFIVAATPPLFNFDFVDRVLCVATIQAIPTTLVVNKVDLATDSLTGDPTEIYSNLNTPILKTSAKLGVGMEEIFAKIDRTDLKIAAFTGISGVGKSSIIGKLIPTEELRVAEVSRKTGQGRQTTTHPQGYLHPRSGAAPAIIIDLPGIQSFGVSHLESGAVASGFEEIRQIGASCQFDNCLHSRERSCAVRDAVESGVIARSRYQSYLKILGEIEEAKPY